MPVQHHGVKQPLYTHQLVRLSSSLGHSHLSVVVVVVCGHQSRKLLAVFFRPSVCVRTRHFDVCK